MFVLLVFSLGLCSRAAELATNTAIGCEALRRKKKKNLASTSGWPSKWSLAPLASKILRLHFFVVCWVSWLDLQVYHLDGTIKITTASTGKETAYICWTTKPSHSSLWEETLQLITARVDAMSCPLVCPRDWMSIHLEIMANIGILLLLYKGINIPIFLT